MLTESLIKFNKNSISKLPVNSGVYRFYDSAKNLLYVGKAKNLKSRVKSYIMNADNINERIKYMIRFLTDCHTRSDNGVLFLTNQRSSFIPRLRTPFLVSSGANLRKAVKISLSFGLDE